MDPSNFPILDHDIVNELKELMEDEFGSLMQIFLDDMPLKIAEIDAAVDQGNLGALYRSAHSLKSGSGNIGALQLSEVARRLEALGRAHSMTEVPTLVQQLHVTATQTEIATRALMD